MNKKRRPHIGDINEAMNTLMRWYRISEKRGKRSAMVETKKIYELLEYMRDHIDLLPDNSKEENSNQ